MSQQKPPANRMTLQVFKARLVGAKKGHGLLKKKRDALKARFSQMLKDIVFTKKAVANGLKESSFALAKAQWANAGDDITSQVIEKAGRPSITCKMSSDNVAGVQLPKFNFLHDPTKDQAPTLGLAHGGAVVNVCRETHLQTMKQIIELASLQTSFLTLDEEIKMTGRRVNALEYVIIPRINDICEYIIMEIDEQAREEFFRVKKVVDKKRQRIELEKKEKDAAEAEKLEKDGPKKKSIAQSDPPSALGGDKDPEIVF